MVCSYVSLLFIIPTDLFVLIFYKYVHHTVLYMVSVAFGIFKLRSLPNIIKITKSGYVW